MRSNQTFLTIVCFGDSLTAGYQSPTHDVPYIVETPYGSFLQEQLGPRSTVISSGVCGEMTGEMVSRFRQDVLARQPNYVVILGGTNDLGWQTDTGEIFNNLVTMYNDAIAAGIQPVAVTVPSIRMAADAVARQWLDDMVSLRQHLNRLIVDYCAKKAMAYIDLFAATAEPDTLLLAASYSNDGLHLTTAGYRKMADLLYEQVFQHRLRDANG